MVCNRGDDLLCSVSLQTSVQPDALLHGASYLNPQQVGVEWPAYRVAGLLYSAPLQTFAQVDVLPCGVSYSNLWQVGAEWEALSARWVLEEETQAD